MTDFYVSMTITMPNPNVPPDLQPPSIIPSENATVIGAPDLYASLALGVAQAPVVIATSKEDIDVPPFPLNHARILYNNLLLNSSVSADTGSNAAGSITPNTFESWSFTTGGTITYTLPQNQQVDTICIGGHNLGSQGASVDVLYSDTTGGATTPITTIAPSNDDPIMVHLGTEIDARRVLIQVGNGAGGAKLIAYVSAGIALQMPRPFFGGHTPITDGDKTDYYNNRTQSGNIIGQQIRRQGFESSAEWSNISDSWYRTYFRDFKDTAKTLPFFFAWNLLQYPQDVGFCRISQDISAPYSGTRDLRQISFSMLGV